MSVRLNALIRTAIADNPEAHSHKIACAVAELTAAEDFTDFYVAALERLVSDLIRSGRNATMNSKQGRSPKLEQRRSWWARMLQERVHVGESKWITLGDCGAEELSFCIGERQDQVGALLGQITKYQTLLDAVVAHGVDTVADLPEGAVEL